VKNLYWIIPGAVVAALACHYLTRDPWVEKQRRLGSELAAAIVSSPEVEIYTLDPAHGGGPQGAPGVLPTHGLFGRRRILGRSLIALADERKELGDALSAGLKGASMMGPECWEPRLAVRYKAHDRDNFLVVSFQCTHGFVDQPDSDPDWFDISRSSEGAWDDILARHHLAKAK
jgi:hypothetical protein